MGVSEAAEAGETALAVVDAARYRLQRVFFVFLIGLVGTIWSLRAFIWDFLKETTESRMEAAVAADLDIIVRTPFDVILLQAKIGIIVGALLAVPMIIYYGRDALFRRGLTPRLPLTRRRRFAFLFVSTVLGIAGVLYAYLIFFPFMFEFLASNAINSAIFPEYDIVYWTEFIILLTISFGLAAQVPLVMTVSSYYEIISYEFFRDRWKYAILGIFLFGALFSPPDPFTQVMWGLPLVGLYFFSLALAKLAANLSRAGSASDPSVRRGLRRKTLLAVAVGGVGALAGGVVARFDLTTDLGDVIGPLLPGAVRPASWSVEPWLPAGGLAGEMAFAIAIGAVTMLLVGTVYAIQVLRRPIPPSASAMMTGDPEALSLRPLDAEGLRAAPIEAFATLTEDEAVSIAQEAIDEGDVDRAEVMLNRFDEAQELAETGELETSEEEAEEGGRMERAAASMLDPFTEDETTEEDVGGYMYDLVFIYESLTSRMFRILMVFLVAMFATFYWLYSGGLGQLQENFLSRVPEEVVETSELGFPVALHPVEHLLFEVKISLIVGIIMALPLLLYYAWPAAKERGLVSGDRRVFLVWGSLIIGILAVGSYLGFVFVAPTLISGLVLHSLEAGMVVSYRLQSFAWLIVFTTVGIGLLFGLLCSMVLFHLTGIISYDTMRGRWKGVVVWTMIIGALVTPGSVLTMLIVTVPTLLTFLVGLATLGLLTGPWRLRGRGGSSTSG